MTSDLGCVAEQSKTGDVGDSMGLHSGNEFGGATVQVQHTSHSRRKIIRTRFVPFARRCNKTGTKGFGEQEPIAWLGSGFCGHRCQIDESGDTEPILWFPIDHRMATSYDCACLSHFIDTPLENGCHDLQIEIFGKTSYGQSEHRTSTHRIDIAQGICRRDRPIAVGLIDDWRKKVHRLHERLALIQLVDGRIITQREPNEQLGARR